MTGAGGWGKTRLGLQVAAGLLDGSGDGVWLVELAAVAEPGRGGAGHRRGAGDAAQPGRPALEALLDALAPQDVLIVLDNCEHLIGGCAKTAEAILRRCPRVRLLATSREPLGIGGETIYRVPSLSLPGPGDSVSAAAESCDAVALFADRARAQGVAPARGRQTVPLVVSVCRRLDGMPLAIELAAARLRSLSLRRAARPAGPAVPAAHRGQPHRAGAAADPAGDGRLVLLAAAPAPSGAAGPPVGVRRGLRPGRRRGGVRVRDSTLLEVAGLLGSLVDKSLVVAEPAGDGAAVPAAGDHPPVRRRAARRGRRRRGRRGHGGALRALPGGGRGRGRSPGGPDQGSWLARLDADQANLRRAAAHAAADPDGTAQVLRFGAALRRYWQARSRDGEAVGLLLPALERPEARADPGLFAAALITAERAARQYDLAAARRLGEQAVEFGRQHGDDRLLIESLTTLCNVYYFAGE